MSENEKKNKEYGGFLPIELNPGNEYFDDYKEVLLRFNSVKASFSYIIMNNQDIEKIYLPYYYCPSTAKAIEQLGVEVYYYHISKEFEPMEIEDSPNTAVILVDYFGVMGKKIKEFGKKYTKSILIFDFAHSFFTEPIIQDKIYNVYSAKKFFGVPDGSYVIGKHIEAEMQEYSFSDLYANYLITTYEKGTNEAYENKKKSDIMISNNYAPMSRFALGLLKNVDYNRVRDVRITNYEYLNQIFKNINEIELPEKNPAYQFPLLISKKGEKIKKVLIDNKVYVSTLWSGDNLEKNASDFERNMCKNAIFLPIDQRYSVNDMEYIANVVRRVLNEDT